MRSTCTPDQTAWQSRLRLAFERRNDQTVLCDSYCEAPLQVQRSYHPEGPDVCHAVILHNAGGMVAGDELTMTVSAAERAHVVLTTASAGKVYRSMGATSRQRVYLRVAAEAVLEWLPQESIVFAGARFCQDLRVDLAPGGVWLGWEITRLGRTARGERFSAGDWRAHTEVWQGERPLWIDRQWVPGGAESCDSLVGLAGQPVVGTLALIGLAVPQALVGQARQAWQDLDVEGEAGVTLLPQGMLCRYRGPATADARRWLQAVWAAIRLQQGGRTAVPPRAWGLGAGGVVAVL